jgi:hypothetical protein
MRVAGKGEGKDSKAMAMATWVAGELMATVTKRAMVAMTILGGTGGGNDPPLCTTR